MLFRPLGGLPCGLRRGGGMDGKRRRAQQLGGLSGAVRWVAGSDLDDHLVLESGLLALAHIAERIGDDPA